MQKVLFIWKQTLQQQITMHLICAVTYFKYRILNFIEILVINKMVGICLNNNNHQFKNHLAVNIILAKYLLKKCYGMETNYLFYYDSFISKWDKSGRTFFFILQKHRDQRNYQSPTLLRLHQL